jgi:uncharacterized membrane protein (DUF485 family)
METARGAAGQAGRAHAATEHRRRAMKKDAEAIINSPEFKDLAARKTSVSTVLSAIMLCAYYGFVLVLAFSKEALSAPLGEGMSVGLLVGLAVILLAWALTGVYVAWANSTYDSAVNSIRKGLRRDA